VPPFIDSHLDLSWNALSFDRDLTRPVEEINACERHMTDSHARCRATVSLPEMRRAQLVLCFATLLAHSRADLCTNSSGPGRISLEYRSPVAASAIMRGQLAYYQLLEQADEMVMIRSAREMQSYWDKWLSCPPGLANESRPIAYLLAMEGADGIVAPEQTADWFQLGLRVASLVHYGHNQYAAGTGETGPLTAAGIDLLKEFRKYGVILDTTHLSDAGFFQALDVFDGPVIASHQNCRALVPGGRQFSDQQMRLLIERAGIIGIAFDNWMITPDWRAGHTPRQEATLDKLVGHIDHVCELAGSHHHVAFGTDLDGGYGSEQTPIEIDTIADIQKLAGLLDARGYSADMIEDIFYRNWYRFLETYLP
jgi:membrane dipeptidase